MESEVCVMLKEYDFSNARKNPYAKALKKQITINIDSNTIDYFKEQAEVVGIPYQTLINLYLKDCVANNRHLSLSWQWEEKQARPVLLRTGFLFANFP